MYNYLNDKDSLDNVFIINTDNNGVDGQIKCPNCGASEIVNNPKTGRLKCSFCSTEFEGRKVVQVTDLTSLDGRVAGSGTMDIKAQDNRVITLKCGGCGAEVIIDMKDAPHARCHWCRSILSVNSKVENGSYPDMILPFSVTREEAEEDIKKFVKMRRWLAKRSFNKEFKTDNILGVYFPYMLIDANCHAKFEGEGEHLLRKRTVSNSEGERETVYDYEVYMVGREYDITIDDLSIETNSAIIDFNDRSITNNIINSIMPFDTQNCVQYHSNYLVGYTAEKRNMNMKDMELKVKKQIRDIVRYAIVPDLQRYDRGVRWEEEDVCIKGTQWMTAYLPVWLYSYQDKNGKIHYVAVNGRTRETMGSVPVNIILVSFLSLLVLCPAIYYMYYYTSEVIRFIESDMINNFVAYVFVILFFVVLSIKFFSFLYNKLRNKNARHKYEVETSNAIRNLVRIDKFCTFVRGGKRSQIEDRNVFTLENAEKIKEAEHYEKIIIIAFIILSAFVLCLALYWVSGNNKYIQNKGVGAVDYSDIAGMYIADGTQYVYITGYENGKEIKNDVSNPYYLALYKDGSYRLEMDNEILTGIYEYNKDSNKLYIKDKYSTISNCEFKDTDNVICDSYASLFTKIDNDL